jgi:Ran GTPase-activating protein (RanGAP) involved in mRNA processing and transport
VRVDLSDNLFGGEAAESLAKALGAQPGLAHLDLRDCGLEDEGVLAVLHALAQSEGARRHLTHLDLSGNDVTPDAMPALAKALRR